MLHHTSFWSKHQDHLSTYNHFSCHTPDKCDCYAILIIATPCSISIKIPTIWVLTITSYIIHQKHMINTSYSTSIQITITIFGDKYRQLYISMYYTMSQHYCIHHYDALHCNALMDNQPTIDHQSFRSISTTWSLLITIDLHKFTLNSSFCPICTTIVSRMLKNIEFDSWIILIGHYSSIHDSRQI